MFPFIAGLAIGYAPVAEIEFANKYGADKISYYDDVSIDYQINLRAGSTYTKSEIAEAIYASSALSLGEIKRIGGTMPVNDKNDFLEIYDISMADLNNPKRFPKEYIGGSSSGSTQVWGYYDPRTRESEIDSIVLSSHGKETNFKIMVHEIAHYWYEAYRIDRLDKISSEDFAVKIQEQSDWRNWRDQYRRNQ